MKKKVLSLVLAAAMVFTMAACGNEGTGESGSHLISHFILFVKFH